MPYRRLPNTDQARLRAIEAGLEKAQITPLKELAFSTQTLDRLQTFYPKFHGAIRQLQTSKQNQFDRSKEYGEIVKKAKLYISHFLQVLSFCIIREEMKPEALEFYGLKANTKVIPTLNLESEILEWGEKVIDGEQKRTRSGGSPIYSPSVALVKVHFEAFKEAYRYQRMLENITNRASLTMSSLRDEADTLIQHMWNEVENRYGLLPGEERREKAASYGISYVFRASELKKIEVEKLQQNIVFS